MAEFDPFSLCESEIEKMMLRALIAADFEWANDPPNTVVPPTWPGNSKDAITILRDVGVVIIPQLDLEPYRVDFAIFMLGEDGDALSIVVECDGHDFHEKTKEQAARDKKRDRFLQAQRYSVFRFTGPEIFKDARACAHEVSDFGAAWLFLQLRKNQRRRGIK